MDPDVHVWLREALDQEIQSIESKLALLKSVPGIGAILSAAIALEIGQIDRLASAGQFAS